MIRHKKIRGHKRIWKSIDLWIERTKHLDLEYLKSNQRDYVKVWVYPYSGISVLNSEFSLPKGTTRKKIIAGLLEIYHQWKQQLETLNEPYYLRIWFYNDDVSKSQVVCAIGDCLDFYENTFFNPKEYKPFPVDNLGLQWEHRHFETHVSELDIGEPEDYYSEKDYLENKKWVNNIMNNPKARKSEQEEFNGKTTTYYSIKASDVWLGFAN
jgi:hypothetical protein